MSKPGSNLPEFRAVQLDFAAHIRNPEENPGPTDVEPRRMKIYADLFFSNVKSFLDSTFPISRDIVGEEAWRKLAREFLHLHHSESPYFLQVSEEFLTFLHQRGLHGLPPFLLELCHYEWVELALDVAVEEADPESYVAQGDLSGAVMVSPLARALVYAYPVHEIGVQNQPESPADNPVYLIVYRNAELKVRFIESNPLTHRLIELLRTQTSTQTASTAFDTLRVELAEAGRTVNAEQITLQGVKILKHLHGLGVILGERI
jgi:hypothetical protein